MKYNIRLERCKRTDPRYQEIRDRHYIPNHGCIGQQIHYLVFLEDEVVGIKYEKPLTLLKYIKI